MLRVVCARCGRRLATVRAYGKTVVTVTDWRHNAIDMDLTGSAAFTVDCRSGEHNGRHVDSEALVNATRRAIENGTVYVLRA